MGYMLCAEVCVERAGLECARARCNKCMRITIAFNKGTFFQFLDRLLGLKKEKQKISGLKVEQRFAF